MIKNHLKQFLPQYGKLYGMMLIALFIYSLPHIITYLFVNHITYTPEDLLIALYNNDCDALFANNDIQVKILSQNLAIYIFVKLLILFYVSLFISVIAIHKYYSASTGLYSKYIVATFNKQIAVWHIFFFLLLLRYAIYIYALDDVLIFLRDSAIANITNIPLLKWPYSLFSTISQKISLIYAQSNGDDYLKKVLSSFTEMYITYCLIQRKQFIKGLALVFFYFMLWFSFIITLYICYGLGTEFKFLLTLGLIPPFIALEFFLYKNYMNSPNFALWCKIIRIAAAQLFLYWIMFYVYFDPIWRAIFI